MAIRDVVTMGYGNGTFAPGVNKIPTLGYSIGEGNEVFDFLGCRTLVPYRRTLAEVPYRATLAEVDYRATLAEVPERC